MKFEWDEAKNAANIEKHGFDFADAAAIFDGPLLVALDTRQDYGEDRWIALGSLNFRVIVVVYVRREADTIRVVSMRKALNYEKSRYEAFLIDRLGEN